VKVGRGLSNAEKTDSNCGITTKHKIIMVAIKNNPVIHGVKSAL
jgi:hypothetical protein